MQYAVEIIKALGLVRPYLILLVVGCGLIFLSGITGIGGVAVVDEMRLFLGYVGVGMVMLAVTLATIRAHKEDKKAQPPTCDHDNDPPAV